MNCGVRVETQSWKRIPFLVVATLRPLIPMAGEKPPPVPVQVASALGLPQQVVDSDCVQLLELGNFTMDECREYISQYTQAEVVSSQVIEEVYRSTKGCPSRLGLVLRAMEENKVIIVQDNLCKVGQPRIAISFFFFLHSPCSLLCVGSIMYVFFFMAVFMNARVCWLHLYVQRCMHVICSFLKRKTHVSICMCIPVQFSGTEFSTIEDVSHSMDGMLERQFDLLSSPEQELLRICAVVGEAAEERLMLHMYSTLQRESALPSVDEISLQQIHEMCAHLVKEGLLVLAAPSPASSVAGDTSLLSYHFNHTTTAFTLYHQMLPSRRANYHRLIYGWFRARISEGRMTNLGRDDLTKLFHHLSHHAYKSLVDVIKDGESEASGIRSRMAGLLFFACEVFLGGGKGGWRLPKRPFEGRKTRDGEAPIVVCIACTIVPCM